MSWLGTSQSTDWTSPGFVLSNLAFQSWHWGGGGHQGCKIILFLSRIAAVSYYHDIPSCRRLMTGRVATNTSHQHHVHFILEPSVPQPLRSPSYFFAFLQLDRSLCGGWWSLWLLRQNQERDSWKVSILRELTDYLAYLSICRVGRGISGNISREVNEGSASPETHVSSGRLAMTSPLPSMGDCTVLSKYLLYK